MSEISFQLVNINNEGTPLKTTFTLLEMWEYIKMFVNVPQYWNVEELEDDKFVDSVNAFYLIETYKDQKYLPLSIQAIN